MSKPDLLAAVEASHDLKCGSDVWMKQLVDALRPSLDRGLGIFGWCYDARDFRNLKFSNPVFVGTPEKLPEALVGIVNDPSGDVQLTERHYSTPAGSFSASLGLAFTSFQPWRNHAYPIGVKDLLVINAIDPNRQGCAISAPRASRSSVSPARVALLARVAAHIAAAHRLRRRADGVSPATKIEAVLRPSGKLDHAEGSARDRACRIALEEAVRAAERARGRLRRLDPHEAMDSWKAMVQGRWSIVDQFENDGRRYLVAYVNRPIAPRVASLSMLERTVISWAALGHSNKLIAYELGVSASTIAVGLRRAKQKLGVSNTVNLVRLYATLRARPVEVESPFGALDAHAKPRESGP
jgi:DNA-binding CsgD family transcriptional regulator